MDEYKRSKSYNKIVFIGYNLSLISDKIVCKFLLNDYNKVIINKYIYLSKSKKAFFEELAKLNSLALVNNPTFSNFNEKKQEIRMCTTSVIFSNTVS